MIRNNPILLFAAGLVLALPGFAQTRTGTISGTVLDPSGGVVVGARVKITISDTSAVAWNGVSSSAGTHVAPLLPVGTYDISAELAGFKRQLMEKVALSIDQNLQVNLNLTPGAVMESVTVTAEVAALRLDSNTSSVATLVTPAQMRDLPLPSSDPMNLMLLVNGVTNGGSATSVATYQMSINGSRTLNTEVTLDGTSVIENVTGQISALPPPDALEEFRVMTSAYSAENGRTSGGTVAVVIRSGTNQLHGGLYELFRNEDLNANNFFSNSKGLARTADRYNQFGGTVRGPVRLPGLYDGRNRTFFLYNFHDTLQRSPSIVTETVPVSSFKAGDFSTASIKVYDPATGTANPTLFPNNTIPAGRIDPAAAKIVGLLPAPNASGSLDAVNSRSINNYLFPQTLQNTGPRHTGKIDHVASEKLRVFGSIFQWASNSPSAKTFDSVLNSNSTQSWHNGYDTSTGVTWLVSPTLFADVRFGFYRWVEMAVPPSIGVDVKQVLGVGTAPANLPPNIAVTGWQSMGPGAASVKQNTSNTFQWSDSITKVMTTHTVKAGFQVRRNQFNTFTPSSYFNGQYTFTGSITNRGGVGGNSINSLADFLLGQVTTSLYELPQPLGGRRNTNMAAYIQDDWKLTPRLTLNGGLRWEYETPMHIQGDIYSRIDPGTGQLLAAGINASDTLNLATSKTNFGPRLGLAYTLTPKTIVRAASGIFYSQVMSNLGSSVQYPGYDVIQSFQLVASGVAQPFTLSQGMPMTGVQDLKNPFAAYKAATPSNPLQAGASGMYAQVTPLSSMLQWNFGVQRELGRKTILESNYVGNRGLHLPLLLHTNQPDFNQGDAIAKAGTTLATQMARQFPALSALAGFYNAGTSSYHSLQVNLRRQFSSNVGLQTAYTWSKSIDDGSGISNFSQPNANAYSSQFPTLFRNVDRSLSSFDIPHRVTVSLQYRTRGSRWVRDWQISPLFVAQMGLPINIAQNNQYPGAVAQRPMYAGTGSLKLDQSYANGQAIQYLKPVNAADFPLTPAGPVYITSGTSRVQLVPAEIGSLGRNVARGPEAVNLNTSLARRFKLSEMFALQLRVDAFNLLNRVNFSNPATSLTVATSGQQAIFNSPGYGLITSSAQARFLQLVARFDF